ncbi:WYL domain-containing protein [Desulfitobacterium sp.]|uniref:helix-turn-helix transcriptional regulator n=1 Tax=Desulfitobacterium sp. TaxID=49981 RepID=UPI002B21F4B8|nr:WYL domain-containing protein [Desulfitobacterium sp.]MEA4900714.1 WYL domain-containing protein [Desulfitobacterium sp.]
MNGKRQKSDEQESCSKTIRILSIYDILNRGNTVNKQQAAVKFSVSDKAIQRDLDDLRAYLDIKSLDEGSYNATIDYNRVNRGYTLNQGSTWLTQEEVLVIAKVLLESRAFSKSELNLLLDKLIAQCLPDTRKHVTEVIQNERFHYLPVAHGQPLLHKIWDVSLAIREHRKVEITYLKPGSSTSISRKLEPCGLIFAEFYFYLIAYIKGLGHDFPTTYRLDRIQSYFLTNQHFRIPEVNRFEEGEFRKRVQFMRAGRLMRITFRFWGPSLDAVLDRLPTAHVIGWDENKAIVEAEVFGDGIKMWLLSQAEFLEVLKPETFRQEMKDTLLRMINNYGRLV